MLLVGLDTGGNRWHTVEKSRGKVVEIDSFKAKDKNPDVRRIELYRSARGYFQQLADADNQVYIFCEEPLSLANGKTTRILGLACGAIWAAHIDCDVTWWWVNVSSWKKDICGKGNVKKDEVELWSILKGEGQEHWDEDHHDSNAIATWGERQLAQLEAGV